MFLTEGYGSGPVGSVAGDDHDQRIHDHASGFTLIELLVVIAILGVLAAVVVLAVSGIRANASNSACPADSRNLVTAAQSYFVLHDATSIPDADGTPDGFEQTLVAVDLLRQVSDWYDLDADGELLLSADSPCTLT